MRAVVQRVSRARVLLQPERTVLSQIDRGLLVLLGIGQGDTRADAKWLVDKIAGLRVFPDDQGNMNCAVSEIGGSLLIVSQFTLYGDCRKGRRPSFTEAMPPGPAEALYEEFLALCRQTGLPTGAGRFGAMMDVELCNDGPVTLLLDSRQRPGA
jgi:D-tyrosyl-tRNA(Tyr) deacylase